MYWCPVQYTVNCVHRWQLRATLRWVRCSSIALADRKWLHKLRKPTARKTLCVGSGIYRQTPLTMSCWETCPSITLTGDKTLVSTFILFCLGRGHYLSSRGVKCCQSTKLSLNAYLENYYKYPMEPTNLVTNTSMAGNIRKYLFFRWHYTGLRVYKDLKSIFTFVMWIPALTLNAVLYLAAAPKSSGGSGSHCEHHHHILRLTCFRSFPQLQLMRRIPDTIFDNCADE